MAFVFILGIMLFLYLIDNLLCAMYCKLKSLKAEKKKNNSSNADLILDEHQTSHKPDTKGSLINIIEGWIRYRLIRVGRFPSHTYRIFLLKHIFKMKIDKNVVIHSGSEIRAPWNIKIGKGSIIGDNCILDGRNGIDIGENVNFSTGVWIWTEEHDHNDPDFLCNNKGGKVVIKDRAWISCRTIILPRIQIGEGAVLAAGAVATTNCQNFMIMGQTVRKLAD